MSAAPLPLETKPLSEGARFVDTFFAPTKTFTDIRHNASWWLPIVFVSLVSIAFGWVLLHKIGLSTLVDSAIHTNARLEGQMSTATAADSARIRAIVGNQFKFIYAAPVLFVITGLAVAGLFLATANFGFGGTAKYKQMLAVWFYGILPVSFISILAIVTIYAGMTSDSFNIKNPVGTNVGYYLLGGSAPAWLETMLSSVDVFTIWSAILLTLGVSIVAGIKRSSAAVVVFGWWAIWILLQTGLAAVTG